MKCFVTFVVFVDVPEVFPVVVFDDVDDGASVVWGDVEFIAQLSAMLLLLLLLVVVTCGVVERRVGEDEWHLKCRTE